MKNKEVIIFLVVALMISTPVVSADNFLTGFSFFDDVGNFFGDIIDFFKGKIIGGETDTFQFGGGEDGIKAIECGNEEIEGNEECDGDNIPQTCVDLGFFEGGTLKCTNCNFDTSDCIISGEECQTDIDCENYPDKICENGICIEKDTLPIYTLTVNVNPTGKGRVNQRFLINEEYTSRDSITLTATPIENYNFDRWGGDYTGTDNPTSLIYMNRNKVITAYFELGTYTLTTSVSPIGGGSITINPEEDEYEEGTEVTLTPHANNGYEFFRWAEGETSLLPEDDGSVIILMDRDKNIIAHFTKKYELTIIIDPEKSKGRVNQRETENNEVELTAIFNENEGYRFKKWTGDIPRNTSEMKNPITISILNNEKKITAHFNETICNDNVDNDGDELIDCYDNVDCNGFHISEGFACAGEEIHEINCNDKIDNDKDNTIDSLDKDCSDSEGLKITEIDFAGEEFLEYSKIPIVDCAYQISPAISSELVKNCVNLTLKNRNMECSSKRAIQNPENSEIGSIEFINCNVGNIVDVVTQSEEKKNIICEVNGLCNGYENQEEHSKLKIIIVSEFNICSESENKPLQKQKGISTFDVFTITSPTEGASFNKGGKLNTIIQARNRFKDENDIGSSIDAKVEAVLISTTTFEEVATKSSEEITIIYLGTKNFNLELAIPPDIENDNYRLYVKVYRNGYEEEICRSINRAVNIVQQAPPPPEDNNGGACNDTDEDSFCSDEDCDNNNPDINPEAEEICTDQIDNNCDGLTDFADPTCIVPGQQRGNEPEPGSEGGERSQTDLDDDGLLDYWEYNYFGDLSQGPNDDFDGDGITNINEYIGNTNPKVSDKKKSSVIWTILLIILGIGILTLAAVFIIKKIKSKRKFTSPNLNYKSSNYSLDQSNQNKLQQYIQQAESQGMKKEDIKRTLLNAGWKEQDIDRFL